MVGGYREGSGFSGFFFLFRRDSCIFIFQVFGKHHPVIQEEAESDDVGSPFGTLFQRIVGGAQDRSHFSSIVSPAHLIESPPVDAEGLVHADMDMVCIGDPVVFVGDTDDGFVGFRFLGTGIEFRRETVQHDAEIHFRVVFALSRGEWDFFDDLGLPITQGDASQQNGDTGMCQHESPAGKVFAKLDDAADDQVDE